MTLIAKSVTTIEGVAYDITSSDTIYIESDVSLSSQNDIGLLSDASNSIINNYGDVAGFYAGVQIDNAMNTVRNFGVIDSSNAGIGSNERNIVIKNFGFINGDQYGLQLSGPDDQVTNAGTIEGVDASIDGSTIVNGLVIQNIGTLDGDVILGDGADSIVSQGKINGNVLLGAGANDFDGRGGSVSGVIQGGNGQDEIHAGNDGEVLAGGKGHDSLFGGVGADTFEFASYSSADYDAIRGFNVTNDTISLDAGAFRHLKPDTTPAFHIGSTASSATDFLFYNSTTGNLYYDVDGSGTAHPAYEIASLQAGLHLTASNFRVISVKL